MPRSGNFHASSMEEGKMRDIKLRSQRSNQRGIRKVQKINTITNDDSTLHTGARERNAGVRSGRRHKKRFGVEGEKFGGGEGK